MRSTIWRAPHAACAGLLVLSIAACGDAPTAPTAAPAFALGLPNDASSTTLDVGQTIQLSANLRSPGKKPRAVTWSSQNAAVATVNGNGLVTAVGAGSTVVIATNGASSESATINVKGPAVAPTPPPPPADTTPAPAPTPPPDPTPAPTGPFALSVPLSAVRFDGGSGDVVVANAVPLPAGALRPGQESTVHVLVNGQEVPVHVRRTAGTRPDGSLRSVLVQFRANLGAAPVAATFAIGGTRAASFTVDSLMTGWQSVPVAAALPTDPNYLVGTGIVGRTLTAAQSASLGGAFARYESDFAQWADYHWANNGSAWTENYYDRAMIYYVMWARTGKPVYFHRAAVHAFNYRKGYLEASNYGPAPHWALMEGLQKHYLLTGDESSRYAVANIAENLWGGYMPSYKGGAASWDLRIVARAMTLQVYAQEIDGRAVIGAWSQPATYGERITDGVGQLVGWQTAEGSYPQDVYCRGQSNFMAGLLNDALVQVYERSAPDPRILTLVRRSADHLWNTQWVPAAQGFQYLNVNCTQEVGSTGAAPDLTQMMVSAYSWLGQRTGDSRYRTIGDQVFAAGIANTYLIGSKQFNEAYTNSWSYTAWR